MMRRLTTGRCVEAHCARQRRVVGCRATASSSTCHSTASNSTLTPQPVSGCPADIRSSAAQHLARAGGRNHHFERQRLLAVRAHQQRFAPRGIKAVND